MNDLYAHIDSHIDQGLQLLERFVAQSSVSAQHVGLEEMAALLAGALHDLGFATVQVLPTKGGPPIVYGEMPGLSDRTLLIYNHYDVQPPEPLERWDTPPFQPVRQDGKVYGRGSCDDKGGIVARLLALAAWRTVRGKLPLHIKCLMEGEEESGSRHFRTFVADHTDLLCADGCLMEANGLEAGDMPVIYAGNKGLLSLELSVRTAQSDAHSAYAPVVPSAAWRLLWALASLKSPDGRIQVVGFYDDVHPLSEAEQAALRAIPLEDEALRCALGVTAFLDDLRGAAWAERLYQAPTCNIGGFITGYNGPGPKTVLPSEARAHVDFRLVPNQKPHDILQKVQRHLAQHGFGDVQIEVFAEQGPARTPMAHPLVQAAVAAAEEVYQRKAPLCPTDAATQPMDVIVEVLGIPAVAPVGGAGYEGSRLHAPNEHIRIRDLAPAARYNALLLQRLAEADC